VDWKRLVQFALLGSSDLEQYAILLVRVSLGLFFAISGANKLFVTGGTKTIYETLAKAKVPFPHQMAYFVSGVDFVGGSLLTVGFPSSPACVALLIDMIGVILTNTLSTMPKGLSPLNWLDDFLYLPEILYVLFFTWLICSGPGKFSVDYWLADKLLRSSVRPRRASAEVKAPAHRKTLAACVALENASNFELFTIHTMYGIRLHHTGLDMKDF
jgi:putative oxidoreductase